MFLKFVINARKKFSKKKEIETKNIKTNNNLTNNKRKLLLFSNFSITIIFVLLSFNPIERIKQIRNLNESYEYIFNVKYENLEIRNFTLTSIYILFRDYYSLVKRNNFLYNENNVIYSFKNKGKVRIVKERDLSINLDEKDCEDCIVELEQNNVVLKKSSKGFQFKLILNPKRININGNELEINSFVKDYLYQYMKLILMLLVFQKMKFILIKRNILKKEDFNSFLFEKKYK